MFGKKDNDTFEEKIQDEIRKQVIKKSMLDKELKKQKEDEEGNLVALEEISDLPKKEIEEIARQVRNKYMNPHKNLFPQKSVVPIWGGIFALIIGLLFVFVLYDGNQGDSSLKKTSLYSVENELEKTSPKIPTKQSTSSEEFLLAAKKGDRNIYRVRIQLGCHI